MLIKDQDAITRLSSPMNLMNRLASLKSNKQDRKSAMNLFGVGRKPEDLIEEVKVTFNPFQPVPDKICERTTSLLPQLSPAQAIASSALIPLPIPEHQSERLDTILDNHESQIKLGLAHDGALKLLSDSVKMLADKLDNIKPDKLPSVIAAASRTVESIRKERSENKKHGGNESVHYHFYTPQQKQVSDYQVIEIQ